MPLYSTHSSVENMLRGPKFLSRKNGTPLPHFHPQATGGHGQEPRPRALSASTLSDTPPSLWPSTLFIIAAQGWPPAVSKACPRGPDAVIRENSPVSPSAHPVALKLSLFSKQLTPAAPLPPRFLAGRPFAASPSPHSASLLCPVSRSGFCVASLILQSWQVATPVELL